MGDEGAAPSIHHPPYTGPERRRVPRTPRVIPRIIGRARVAPAFARLVISLDPHRWYSVVDCHPETEPPEAPAGFVWLDLQLKPGEAIPSTRVASMGTSQPAAAPVVLVVEDELLVLRLMINALKEARYHVHGAADGSEALTLAAELPTPPVLLVTDLRMDPIDGVTLSRMLQSSYPGIRVLFVGGYGTGGDVGEVPGRVLVKPFSKQQLVQAVKEVLSAE